MTQLTFEAVNEADTARFGSALAESLPSGATVALCGTLGAGKTRVVQAMAEAYGVDRREVLSPTFVLVQEYHGRRSLCHIDAYRIRDEEEFEALGSDEFFDLQGDGVTLVEWADRVKNCLPKDRLEVHIEVTGAESRRIKVISVGGKYAAAVERLRDVLGQ